jgi:Dimerisation domain
VIEANLRGGLTFRLSSIVIHMHAAGPQLDPGSILQTAFAFWSSKVLLTAVEFDVFTKLGSRHIAGAELGREVGLHPRGISDFFDALVAMKFLCREGDGPDAKYFNTRSASLYLDSARLSICEIGIT